MGASVDNDPDFTDEFCRFLQRSVANVDAAEVLLAVFRDPRRAWNSSELIAQLAPLTSLSEAELQRSLDAFHNASLVVRGADQRVRYSPSAAHDAHVAALARLYVERPVTLFRVIYAMRDMKITTFADAFKLRR